MTCLDRPDDASRKCKLSTSASFDTEFIAFLQGTFDSPTCGEPGSACADAAMTDVVGAYATQLAATAAAAAPSDMNDLHGALCVDQQAGLQQNDASAAMSLEPSTTQTSAQLKMAPSHRAVTTCMPLPRTSSAAVAAAAAAGAAGDDDTVSAVTLPMPHKRRRTCDDEEVTSSPNDLVEVPSTGGSSAAARRAAAAAAAGRDRGTANNNHTLPSSSAQSADTAAVAAAAPAAGDAQAAAASDADVPKSILVSKVLTKSDANSKRIILPRIAVEFNLPQLTNATAFHLTATDPSGQAWPLVIKAWANGQNPKPVYVLEQVGEMLKQYKLTVGDAVALLAAQDGSRFFLDWNTEAARAAAARPILSGVFGGSSTSTPKQEKKPHAKTGSSGGHKAHAVAKPPVPPATQQQQQQVPPRASVQQPVQKLQLPRIMPQQQPAQQLQMALQQRAPAAVPLPAAPIKQQPQLAPLMTAVPVNATPFVPGTFIPTSPCQLLVMGDGNVAPYFTVEEPGAPSAPSSMLITRSDAAMELPEADVLLMATAHGGGSAGLQCGSYLLCPRTPGCSRPAGHQGWCLGHKGYKKKQRV